MDITGDSMTQLPSSAGGSTVATDLKKVLKNLFNKHFNNDGNTLSHGMQDDTYSCSVCTVNAVDHMLFSATVFKPKNC